MAWCPYTVLLHSALTPVLLRSPLSTGEGISVRTPLFSSKSFGVSSIRRLQFQSRLMIAEMSMALDYSQNGQILLFVTRCAVGVADLEQVHDSPASVRICLYSRFTLFERAEVR